MSPERLNCLGRMFRAANPPRPPREGEVESIWPCLLDTWQMIKQWVVNTSGAGRQDLGEGGSAKPGLDCLTRPPMEEILRIPLCLLHLAGRMLAFVMETTP